MTESLGLFAFCESGKLADQRLSIRESDVSTHVKYPSERGEIPFRGGHRYVRNLIKYPSEVVIITFGTVLNTPQDGIKYPSERY